MGARAQGPIPQGARHVVNFVRAELKTQLRKQVLRGKGVSLMELTVSMFSELNPEQLVFREHPEPDYFLFLSNKAAMYYRGGVWGRWSAGGGDQNGFVSAKIASCMAETGGSRSHRGK